MNENQSQIIETDGGVFSDVREMILRTREGVAKSVNTGLTLLYWRIGHRIQNEILNHERAEYGKEVIASLSSSLTSEFGRGFGKRNLFTMVRFAEVFSDIEIVQSLIAQLGWTHFQALLPLKDPLQREFYAESNQREQRIRKMIHGII